MPNIRKEKKWFKPIFEDEKPKNVSKNTDAPCKEKESPEIKEKSHKIPIITNHENWMKKFDPEKVEDLAVHHKKIQEIEDWIKMVCNHSCSEMLLVSGPVGCGKTITVQTIAAKYKMKVTEWITPIDIDIPSDFREFEFKEKQSKKFLDFILNAANFTSLLDNNFNKLVLVEDFPNTFIRTPSEFTQVLEQYKHRARSPIVFICSESHTDNKNSALNLFTPALKEQFKIHHITLNSVATTGLRSALKRVSDIISRKHANVYNPPTPDLIECVVNSSAGDVRSAVLNLHFACLQGSRQNLETSVYAGKETKSKTAAKKRKLNTKFSSIGKDQTVSILHGVGRVLNPKAAEGNSNKFTHSPSEVIEQFTSQPTSFINFLHENYLTHYSCIEHVEKAASDLSDADFMLAEWREKLCQEYGLYTAVAGLMTSNKAPVSSWNPVRGPKNMKVVYPSPSELPLLEENYLYKGTVLATDFHSYCKIIGK